MAIESPIFFLLIPVAVAVVYYAGKIREKPSIRFSSARFLKISRPTLKTYLADNLWLLRLLALIFLIFALARPRTALQESKIQTEGIDIVLALDTSTSMLAEDFTLNGKRINRLDIVKEVVKNFIQGRKNDRIGMVAFAAMAYTVSPLTLDYGWCLENLKRVKTGIIEDGTAIGSGLSTALNRLKDTKAKSKIVILLTDGINNAGKISPALSAGAAKALGIKVYTIGAGTKGIAPYPVQNIFGNTVYQPVKIDIDEDTLREIAEKTGGKYFRATDTKSLREIYQEIDKMEKTPAEEKGYMEYKELFPVFLVISLALLLIEIILAGTWLRKIP